MSLGSTWAAAAVLWLAAGPPGAARGPESLAGKPAPAFVRTSLDQQQVDLGRLRGKVVLLNFWATWCAPCLEEMPRFEKWQKQYGPSGLQMIGISMDDGDAPVRALMRKQGIDYPILMGDEKLGDLYGQVLGLPVTFLIDRGGRVAAVFKGEPDLNALEQRVRTCLGTTD